SLRLAALMQISKKSLLPFSSRFFPARRSDELRRHVRENPRPREIHAERYAVYAKFFSITQHEANGPVTRTVNRRIFPPAGLDFYPRRIAVFLIHRHICKHICSRAATT